MASWGVEVDAEDCDEEFDFALELRRDAQYRLVAGRQPPGLAREMPAAEVEAEQDLEAGCAARESLDAEVGSSHADSYVAFVMAETPGPADDGADEQEPLDLDPAVSGPRKESRSSDAVVSVQEYVAAVRGLRQRQRRATTAARRSSVAFSERYESSDQEALNRLLYALGAGVNVRRYQTGCRAEMVRLFSLNGGRTIHWAPEAVRPVGRLARLDSVRTGTQLMREQARDSGLDCCIASNCLLTARHRFTSFQSAAAVMTC